MIILPKLRAGKSLAVLILWLGGGGVASSVVVVVLDEEIQGNAVEPETATKVCTTSQDNCGVDAGAGLVDDDFDERYYGTSNGTQQPLRNASSNTHHEEEQLLMAIETDHQTQSKVEDDEGDENGDEYDENNEFDVDEDEDEDEEDDDEEDYDEEDYDEEDRDDVEQDDEDDEDDVDDQDEEDDDDEDKIPGRAPGTRFGVAQIIEQEFVDAQEVWAKLHDTEAYMEDFAATEDYFVHLRHDCKNEDEYCTVFAAMGHCEKQPEYMFHECAPACGKCKKPNDGPGVEFGVLQELNFEDIADGAADLLTPESIAARIEETERYMREIIWADDFYMTVRKKCFNHEDMCTIWAALGECDNNRPYMVEFCSPACGTCKELHYDTRCAAADPNDPNVWGPGDLNRMFERIVATGDSSDYQEQTINGEDTNHENRTVEITVLSRPNYLPGDDEHSANYKVGPWIVAIDNFLTPHEADRLIYLGTQEGYEQSTGVGLWNEETGEHDPAVVEDRTSTNAWCYEDCKNDPIVRNVWGRIEALTGIPQENSELLQLLKYEEGQFYFTHHDYLEHEQHTIQGPRILTVFIYLNDVEEGGVTRFDWFGDADVKVEPKLGRVVLWPSVLDEDPSEIDNRTYHQALPVLRGEKYAANAWLHLRNRDKAAEMNC
ncbi:hypothetical protein ACA910_013793 [Epithemia clementina (nom. ined.)]